MISTQRERQDAYDVDVDPDMPLLWAIRDGIGLTGTKYGCGIAHVRRVHRARRRQGRCARAACRSPPPPGRRITTIENVGATRAGKAVQAAWEKLDVVQCGYCQSGQIMSAAALLAEEAEAHRCRHRRGDGGQRLPLRDLRAHPRGDQGSREGPSHERARHDQRTSIRAGASS